MAKSTRPKKGAKKAVKSAKPASKAIKSTKPASSKSTSTKSKNAKTSSTKGKAGSTGKNKTTSALSGKRFFGEQPVSVDGNVTLDGSKFVNADDSQYYNSDYYIHHKDAVLAFRATTDPGYIDLGNVLPQATIDKIKAAGQISFHSVGDTGATTLSKFDNTESVADMMAVDLKSNNGPCFFFHLGDVIYNFGEEDYYYEQFYDAYRNYNAPIFAIPGNHDGMVFNATMQSLQAFEENFCTNGPQMAINAGTLMRTTMDQPGVYFTLDAPFVSIIGLYSNVLDGNPGGVISSMNNKFPTVGDAQIKFLTNELARLKAKRATDHRAIILAVHHPLFSGDSKNGGSPLMTKDLMSVFEKAGVWPDAILSGHAHNYERFAWTVNGKIIPCLISGSGGFNMTPVKNAPAHYPYAIPGRTDLVMENYLPMYGYLEITVNGKQRSLTIDFNSPQTPKSAAKRNADSVTVKW